MDMDAARSLEAISPWIVLAGVLAGCDPSGLGTAAGGTTTDGGTSSSAPTGAAPAVSTSGPQTSDTTGGGMPDSNSGPIETTVGGLPPDGTTSSDTTGGGMPDSNSGSETTVGRLPPDGTTSTSSASESSDSQGGSSSTTSGSSTSGSAESSSSTGEPLYAELWAYDLPLDVTPRFLERLGDGLMVVVAEDLEAERVVIVGLDDAGEEQFVHEFQGFEGHVWGSDVPESLADWWQYTPRLVTSSTVRGVDELLLVIASTVYSFDSELGTLNELPIFTKIPLPGYWGYVSIDVQLVAASADGRVAVRGNGPYSLSDYAVIGYDAALGVDFFEEDWQPGPGVMAAQQLMRTNYFGHVFSGGTSIDLTPTFQSIAAYDSDGGFSYFSDSPLFLTSWEGGFMYAAFSCMAQLSDGSIAIVQGFADLDGGVDPPFALFERWSINDALLTSFTLPVDAWGVDCAPATDDSGAYIAVRGQLVRMTPDGAPSVVHDDETAAFIDLVLAPENLKVTLVEEMDGVGTVRALSVD